MKLSSIIRFSFVVICLWSCTEKNKESQDTQRIKIDSSAPEKREQPVQIPMHGTKENNSSGLTSFKIEEQEKENAAVKNTIQE